MINLMSFCPFPLKLPLTFPPFSLLFSVKCISVPQFDFSPHQIDFFYTWLFILYCGLGFMNVYWITVLLASWSSTIDICAASWISTFFLFFHIICLAALFWLLGSLGYWNIEWYYFKNNQKTTEWLCEHVGQSYGNTMQKGRNFSTICRFDNKYNTC